MIKKILNMFIEKLWAKKITIKSNMQKSTFVQKKLQQDLRTRFQEWSCSAGKDCRDPTGRKTLCMSEDLN